jgi:hypothetical protein
MFNNSISGLVLINKANININKNDINYNYNQIEQNRNNQNNKNNSLEDSINNLNRKIGDNKKSATDGSIIGSSINGILTLGLAAATLFNFRIIYGIIATMQFQLYQLSFGLIDLSTEIKALKAFNVAQQAESRATNTALQAQITLLEGLIIEIQAKTILLDGPIFTGDLILNGNIIQTNPFGLNILESSTNIQQNLLVGGIITNLDLSLDLL